MDDEYDDVLPEFFNVYLKLHSFHQMLIPREFGVYLKSGLAELMADSSDETWRVALTCDGNDWHFTEGWKEFVEDNLIRDGNFMFFKFHGDLKFSVTVYDESMCEKEMGNCRRGRGGGGDYCQEPNVMTVKREDISEVEAVQLFPQEGEAAEQSTKAKPFFEKCITATSVNITIPNAFVREQSLRYKSNEKMILRTTENSYEINIVKNRGRIVLCGGWPTFVGKNCIKAGDVCKFELVERLEMMVHVARKQKIGSDKKTLK